MECWSIGVLTDYLKILIFSITPSLQYSNNISAREVYITKLDMESKLCPDSSTSVTPSKMA
jgi:hypothetical protein